MRTGLVLGAGGLVGQAFHLGALSALQELSGFDGRDCDVLVGTSAGSLVAAALAGGLGAADQAAEVLGEPVSAQGAALRAVVHAQRPAAQEADEPSRRPLAPLAVLAAARHPLRTRPGAVVSSLLPAGSNSTEPISRGVRRLHGERWPDRDVRICSLRAADAHRVVFGTPGAPKTDLGTAVAASCAIPGWFRPVRIDGRPYVDGGGHSPTNADVLVTDHLDLVVVLSPMTLLRAAPRPDLPLRLTVRGYLSQEVRQLRKAGARVVVVQPTQADLAVMGTNPMRGSGLDEVVRTAAASVRRRLIAQPSLAADLAQQ